MPGNSRSTWKICKIWDEIWSDLALWDGDFGGSYFNTKLFLSQSHLPLFFFFFFFITQTQNINLSSNQPFFQFILCFFKNLQSIFTFSQMGMAAESQFHVLAVDDSLIDRKLIERLLRTSSYQGTIF